jgi:HPr kinase/phosphorylase
MAGVRTLSGEGDLSTLNIHATAVAWGDRGCLLRGKSGAGKSDLALRFLFTPIYLDSDPEMPNMGARDGRSLIADDRVVVTRETNYLSICAPQAIVGQLEVRGIGIIKPPSTRAIARLCLIVDLVTPDAVPRMPDTGYETMLGLAIPRMDLTPFEASAPLKLALAISRCG